MNSDSRTVLGIIPLAKTESKREREKERLSFADGEQERSLEADRLSLPFPSH